MRPGNRTKLIFTIVAVICLLVSGYNALMQFTSYTYGFSLDFDEDFQRAKISEVYPAGAAASAGLEAGDIIEEFNGQTADKWSECLECMEAARKKPEVKLLVKRQGEPVSIVVAGQRYLSFYHSLFVLIGAFYILLGWWVIYSRPLYSAARAWGYFSLLLGSLILPTGFHIFATNLISVLLGILFVAMYVFSAAAALHFSLVFPQVGRLARRKLTIPIIYTIAAAVQVVVSLGLLLLMFVLESYQLYSFLDGSIGITILVFWIGYLSLTVFILVRTYLRTAEQEEKRRIRWIIFGTAVPLGFIVFMILLETLLSITLPFPEWAIPIALGAIPVTYFYAIVRHRAMQIELIIRRGLIYSVITGAVLLITGILYVVVIGLMLIAQDLLPALTGGQDIFSSFALDPTVQRVAIAVWAVVVGATLGKVKRRAQDFVDRRFYRQKYNYRQALQQLTSVMEETGDRDSLLAIVFDNAEKLVHPRSIALCLIGDDGSAVVVKAEPEVLINAKLGANVASSLSAFFEQGRRFLGRRELEEEGQPGFEQAKSAFTLMSADLCFPLQVESGIQGFVFFGPKRSGQVYNTEDVELLRLLSDQAARGLDHLRLVAAAAERERIKRELEIGQQIQRSLLPRALPRLRGASLAAVSIPAMEVGGDFYTFIDYGPRKLGIIIGDIVGKGVAGALNMAATITSMRLIAEESAGVSETMQRLNRYLVRNSTNRSFAAVLFAVLDLREKTLRWSNAGLPEPVLIPTQGSVRFLETPPYPLPPGASRRSAYLEAHYDLQGGESFVFVTDGLVEARPVDGSDEDFGFDGLIGHLSEHRCRDPHAILQSLSEGLKEYRGDSALEDDFTAIAIHIELLKKGVKD